MIETLTGQWLGDFLREKIWQPLDMKDTYYGLYDVKKRRSTKDVAKCHRWDEDEEVLKEMPWMDQPEGSGCGEMFSNVLDYAKFLKCMINKSAPFSEEAHKELVKPRIICDPDEEPKPFCSYRLYALGWDLETFHGETVIGHGGSVTGFACKMMFIPRLNWGLVAFGNKDYADQAIDGISGALVDDLLGVPEEERFDWDAEAQRIEDEYEPETREELFPNVPDPPIPLSRPLKEYAGTYEHAGYGTMVVEVRGKKLFIDCTDRTWRFMFTLEHVSGDFFFVERKELYSEESDTGIAQFKVDVDGTVRSFGVNLIDGMEDQDDPMVWFEREVSSS